ASGTRRTTTSTTPGAACLPTCRSASSTARSTGNRGSRASRRRKMNDPRIDPEGKRLPIKIDTTSNGEFAPVPLSAKNLMGNRLAHEAATERAKRLGLSRREFLVSACGAASTLLAFNDANAMSGGFFDLPREAALDLQLAQATVGAKREFIFDVQGHF